METCRYGLDGENGRGIFEEGWRGGGVYLEAVSCIFGFFFSFLYAGEEITKEV